MSAFVATMHTEHFTFQSAGKTEEEAISAMVQTMRRHRTQCGGDAWEPEGYIFAAEMNAPHPEAYDDPAQGDYEWLRWLAQVWYSMSVAQLSFGAAGTRDGVPIRLKELT